MRISDWSSDVCSSDLPLRRWSNNLEPILIYGFPLGSSMGLVAALEWLGKPYRLCRVDMLGEMREPAYARINARHETPVLITDQGKVLTETMAIAHWFAARDDERRLSPDQMSAEGDRLRQIMAFINTGFTGDRHSAGKGNRVTVRG